VTDPLQDHVETEQESEDLFAFDELTGGSEGADDVASVVAAADTAILEELIGALPSLEEDEPSEEDIVDTLIEAADTETDEVEIEEEAPAAQVVVSSTRMSPALVAGLVAATVLNLLLVGFTWWTSRDIKDSFADIGKSVLETTESIRDETAQRALDIQEFAAPLVAQDAEGTQVFELVGQDLERGDYRMARRRLNGLLAVVDGMPPEARRDIEARASFMLADTLVVEARALEGRDPALVPAMGPAMGVVQ
jgi:hypothetical protein